jgi:hypothetical protein
VLSELSWEEPTSPRLKKRLLPVLAVVTVWAEGCGVWMDGGLLSGGGDGHGGSGAWAFCGEREGEQ